MEISCTQDFYNLIADLRMSQDKENKKSLRYHTILKIINQHYYFSSSDSTHGLYVGSQGRGTDIYTSDIDIVVILPWSTYNQYDNRAYNGQSALLQEVKCIIQRTYPRTSIKGDGQVVVVEFEDGMRFEIVPAFEFEDGSFTYPNANGGGTWMYMSPREEIRIFNEMNKECNGNLKNLCRMIREWNKINNVGLQGIVLDTMAYRFLSSYRYKNESYLYYDFMSRDFFEYLVKNGYKNWNVPGGHWQVTPNVNYVRKAQEAYNNALAAISAASKGYSFSYREDWRSIYGTRF